MRTIKAVIFDKDGVIVDSEPLQYRSIKQILAEYGYRYTKKDNRLLSLGKAGHESYRLIQKKYKISDMEMFIKKRRERYMLLSQQKLRLRPGMKNLIQKLYKKYPLAVASGSTHSHVYHDLEKFHLANYFQVITPGDHVKSKPDPEIFLETAKKLGVNSSECLVIEDTELGVKAAKHAGMVCIAFPNAYTKYQDFSNVDSLCKNVYEISNFLIA